MKVTKYQHACLFIENGNGTVVIDPGSFTDLPTELNDIVAVIVTEEHYDHFDTENLKKILAQNPDARIYTTQNVSNALAKDAIAATAITDTQTITVDDFSITLRPVDHATVYQKSPCTSLTVTVDDYLYYPSDSYALPTKPVKILALPTSGPWFKVSESIDFTKSIDSEVVIATHNAINSDIGNNIAKTYVSGHLPDHRKYIHLEPGESYSGN